MMTKEIQSAVLLLTSHGWGVQPPAVVQVAQPAAPAPEPAKAQPEPAAEPETPRMITCSNCGESHPAGSPEAHNARTCEKGKTTTAQPSGAKPPPPPVKPSGSAPSLDSVMADFDLGGLDLGDLPVPTAPAKVPNAPESVAAAPRKADPFADLEPIAGLDML
jgi:hypothetical protein